MDTPPARKPTQHARQRALRQQARAGDPVAQAQVDALNARNRASAAKAKAAGRPYRYPARKAAGRAQKQAALLLTRTPAEVAHARQRRARLAAAKQQRAAAAAAPPTPVRSAAERAAQAKAQNLARNRAAYRARKQHMAAGDPDARATYEQRSESARQGALNRWRKRAAPNA